MFESINEVSVLVSALLAVAVGNIWYSPIVFGNIWARALGRLSNENSLSEKDIFALVSKSVVVQALFFFVLAQVLTMVEKLQFGVFEVGTLVVLLIAIQMMSVNVWEQKPISYFCIHVGYIMTITFGGLAVIAYWPW